MWRRIVGVAALLTMMSAVGLSCQSEENVGQTQPRGRDAAADIGSADVGRDAGRRDATIDVAADALVEVSVEDGDSSAAEAGTNDSGAPQLDPACTSCLEANCDIPLRSCRPDPGCRALLSCLAGPTPACKSAFTCAASAAARSDSIACMSSIAGDGGSIDYFASVNLCAAACASVCPPPPFEDETIASCKTDFQTAYPSLATRCQAAEQCLCTRCPVAIHDCAAESECSQLLSCELGTGCSGIECYAICPNIVWTLAGIDADSCYSKQCEPCSAADARP